MVMNEKLDNSEKWNYEKDFKINNIYLIFEANIINKNLNKKEFELTSYKYIII